MNRVVAVIPARLDSTRFPAKMIADETGKPLIQYAWEVATQASSVDQVLVATDAPLIADVVNAFGGECVMTGEHPNGTSRIAEATANFECDLVVNMQGDEPELDPSVIDALVHSIGTYSMGTACCPLYPEERDNENVVKVILGEDGTAADFVRQMPRCDAFRHLGLYVYTPEFLQQFVSMLPTENERTRRLEQMRAVDHGYSIAVASVAPQPSGIDTPEQYASFVARVNRGL
ncbi:MAG: 3-deoxy-manno-octulosonate cytidylyltransferase [Phycisphaerales bacterium]|jgi:3-deoxy-manno-octulosonate cytidylyltransferase (CMP-KDO synthetase)|nr:3-deoxy-manno-octulosonate cytidylyltransferase [Phycisphaerales bacterium]